MLILVSVHQIIRVSHQLGLLPRGRSSLIIAPMPYRFRCSSRRSCDCSDDQLVTLILISMHQFSFVIELLYLTISCFVLTIHTLQCPHKSMTKEKCVPKVKSYINCTLREIKSEANRTYSRNTKTK